MKHEAVWFHIGSMSVFMAGVILAIIAGVGSNPLVVGLTAGAGASFVVTGILLTIRRRRQR